MTQLEDIDEYLQLVHIYCSRRHLVGVLLRNAPGEVPYLALPSGAGWSEAFALTPEGFKGAFSVGDGFHHDLLGPGEAWIGVGCHKCNADFRLDADTTRSKADAVLSGRRKRERVTLGVLPPE